MDSIMIRMLSKIHQRHPAVVAVLSIAVSLAVVGFAIPRGLDLTDESLYVLLAQPDAPRFLSVIHTQLIFHTIHALTGWSAGIQGLRIARLCLLLTSTLWLANSFNDPHSKSHSHRTFLLGALAFAFLQYTGNGRIFSLGYNAMNWAWGAWFVGCWIRWVRDERRWAPLGMGCALALMWLTKFPSALLLGGLGFCMAAWQSGQPIHQLTWAFAKACLPIATLFFLAPMGGHDVLPWTFWSQLITSTDAHHATDSLLIQSGRQALQFYGPVALCGALGVWGRRHGQTSSITQTVWALVVAASILLALADVVTLRHFRLGHWLLAAGAFAGLLGLEEDPVKRRLGIFFLLTPIALTTGTNVHWTGHLMPLTGWMWMGALWLGPSRPLVLATLCVPWLLLPDIALHPYRQAPLQEASTAVTLDGIHLSSTVASYLDSVHHVTSAYPFPMVGSDRFFGEMLLHGSVPEGELLWASESLSDGHIASWSKQDTLVFGLCNSTEKEFFESALTPFQWTSIGRVNRTGYLSESARFSWGIPPQNAHVEFFLLTKQP